MRLDAQQNGEGYKLTPPPPERVNLNAADVEWARAMLVKHPLTCFEQKLTLTGSRERVPRRTYILATGWSSPFEKSRGSSIKIRPGWSSVSIVDISSCWIILRNSPTY